MLLFVKENSSSIFLFPRHSLHSYKFYESCLFSLSLLSIFPFSFPFYRSNFMCSSCVCKCCLCLAVGKCVFFFLIFISSLSSLPTSRHATTKNTEHSTQQREEKHFSLTTASEWVNEWERRNKEKKKSFSKWRLVETCHESKEWKINSPRFFFLLNFFPPFDEAKGRKKARTNFYIYVTCDGKKLRHMNISVMEDEEINFWHIFFYLIWMQNA